MKKIVTIIGARPQFIKTALLSWELRKSFEEVVIHTGQHYDLNMSDIFYKDLDLPEVNYNLGVGSGPQGKQTALMLEKIEEVLIYEKPDLVLIYGDTNSTVAGALAAAKLHIPVGHVESGMRSFNRQMPEEINRIVADHLSELLFCSTETSKELLAKEGITNNAYEVGDVMYDLQRHFASKNDDKILQELEIQPQKYLLATVHRQENTDVKENLEKILTALIKIDEPIIFPIHPRTKKCIEDYGFSKILARNPNIKLIDPISYTETVTLEGNARLIITDSGGIQKEAYALKVPCITLRNETEWTETVESGWNQLAGQNIDKILDLVKNLPKPKNHPDFLGQGDAYIKIAQIIKDFLN